MSEGTLVGAPAGASSIGLVRRDFPILSQVINGKPLVYLDNAATSQKPRVVLDALSRYYQEENANIHRGVHQLSERATDAYESARHRLATFLGASSDAEIVFTRGTTDAINLVAQSYGGSRLRPGDEVIVSTMEHHSNIVPWQQICGRVGAKLQVIPIDDDGDLDMAAFQKLLTAKTRLVAITHVSNAIGTVNPIRSIVRMAHESGAVVLVDGAQSAPHLAVNVQDLGCDFFACSGHKMLGPTGIGVLFGRAEILATMPPYQTGGGMIARVAFDNTTFAESPGRFEAGTPSIAGAIGLAAAVDYMSSIGMDRIEQHESALLSFATDCLRALPGVRLVGADAALRASVLSFVVDGVHPHDVGTILDQEGVAVRAGHHCAQPLMDRYGVPGTVRASFGFYNTLDEIDILVNGLRRVQAVFN